MVSEIRIGDEVQLKSGGPIMTVTKIWAERGRTMAQCDWLDRGQQNVGSVSITSLQLADRS